MKVPGAVGGRRAKAASALGTVMTSPGLISECHSVIGDATRVAEVSCAQDCWAMRTGYFFGGGGGRVASLNPNHPAALKLPCLMF